MHSCAKAGAGLQATRGASPRRGTAAGAYCMLSMLGNLLSMPVNMFSVQVSAPKNIMIVSADWHSLTQPCQSQWALQGCFLVHLTLDAAFEIRSTSTVFLLS